MNPTEISDALPFDAAEFPYAFASATGNAKATVSKRRPGAPSLNKSKLPGAVLMNRKFYFTPADLGGVDTALDRIGAHTKKTPRHKPANIFATDDSPNRLIQKI